MRLADNPNVFALNPLDRASDRRQNPEWVAAQAARGDARLVLFRKGDPLVETRGEAVEVLWLLGPARGELPAEAPAVLLGLRDEVPHFAIDVSGAREAPFADLGSYLPMRDVAGALPAAEMAILGQGRWMLDWHRRHRFCPNCGTQTEMDAAGVRRLCPGCDAEHFPRTDPVSIVLPVRGDKCLLGSNRRFPPPFHSALAGFVEAGETFEECAVRETWEEVGLRLSDVRYQFAQPWPFPSSLMVGFIAEAENEDFHIDGEEIVAARWIARAEMRELIAGARREDLRISPPFTIARKLIETWVGEG